MDYEFPLDEKKDFSESESEAMSEGEDSSEGYSTEGSNPEYKQYLKQYKNPNATFSSIKYGPQEPTVSTNSKTNNQCPSLKECCLHTLLKTGITPTQKTLLPSDVYNEYESYKHQNEHYQLIKELNTLNLQHIHSFEQFNVCSMGVSNKSPYTLLFLVKNVDLNNDVIEVLPPQSNISRAKAIEFNYKDNHREYFFGFIVNDNITSDLFYISSNGEFKCNKEGQLTFYKKNDPINNSFIVENSYDKPLLVECVTHMPVGITKITSKYILPGDVAVITKPDNTATLTVRAYAIEKNVTKPQILNHATPQSLHHKELYLDVLENEKYTIIITPAITYQKKENLNSDNECNYSK